MTILSTAPDNAALEIVSDAWTDPFWRAAAQDRLELPHCVPCGHFRWPPGPFCPRCRSQEVRWIEPGDATLYSFTIVPAKGADGSELVRIPGLVEFAGAPGARIVAAIVGADPASLQIGQRLTVEWADAANGRLPLFRPAVRKA